MSTVFGCFGIYIVLMFVNVLNNCYVFVFCDVPYGIMDIMASLCQYHMYINQSLLHVYALVNKLIG